MHSEKHSCLDNEEQCVGNTMICCIEPRNMTSFHLIRMAFLLLLFVIATSCASKFESTLPRDTLESKLVENVSWCDLPKELTKNKILIPIGNNCTSFQVLRCYCLTVERCTSQLCSSQPRFVVGKCLYGCFKSDPYAEYHKTSLLSVSDVCSEVNRKGALCGQCREGHGVPAYSFSLKCISCGNESLWVTIPRYVLVAYGPLTLFLILIVVFTVSVNSAPLRGWILVCQITSSQIIMIILTLDNEFHSNAGLTPYMQILGTICGVWNLDFFRAVYKPFCIHPSLSTLQVLSLDYIIAAYPLLLIVVMYTIVELYGHGYRPVVTIGRLFHCCFVRFRHKLNIRTSLIDAFGTFFSLSFVKFVSTSASLLASSEVWYSERNAKSWRVYFDGSKEPFKGSHIPYAVTALLFTLLFNILPLILILLHSFPKGQIVLKVVPAPLKRAIYPFIDNILGCYKDGTNGTKNCRYFAVVYYFALFGSLSSLAIVKSPVLLGCAAYVCILAGMLVAVVQPYKSNVYNTVDIVLTLSVGLCLTGSMSFFIAFIEAPFERPLTFTMFILPLLTLVIYPIGYIGLILYWKVRCFFLCFKNKMHFRGNNEEFLHSLLFNIT